LTLEDSDLDLFSSDRDALLVKLDLSESLCLFLKSFRKNRVEFGLHVVVHAVNFGHLEEVRDVLLLSTTPLEVMLTIPHGGVRVRVRIRIRVRVRIRIRIRVRVRVLEVYLTEGTISSTLLENISFTAELPTLASSPYMACAFMKCSIADFHFSP